MVYRRRKTSRRTYKRKTAKRGFRKRFSRGSKFNKPGVVQVKLRYHDTLTTDGTGTIQRYYNMANPTMVANGSGTANDWTSLSSLYDSYRVCGMSLKAFPSRYNDDTSGVGTDWNPMYLAWDPDGTPNFTVADFISVETCKIKNAFRPWSYYHYLPRMINPSAQTTATDLKGGWMDIAAPQSTSYISLYSEGYNPSVKLLEVIVTYYVQYKARR